VVGIFCDTWDEKVHREMCIDAQKTVQWFLSYFDFASKLIVEVTLLIFRPIMRLNPLKGQLSFCYVLIAGIHND